MSDFTDGDRKRMKRAREGKKRHWERKERKRENRSNTEKLCSKG